MAVITGITNWSGKVDGLVFYMLNGKQIVRRVPSPRPGPKSAGMKKAKLRNIEFGNAASAGKHLRNALEPECSLIRNKQIHQPVTALMMKLKDFHEAPLGKKTAHEGLKTPQGKACLASFTFQNSSKRHPWMTDALKKGNSIQVEIIPCAIMPYYLIELQVNLETGTFRRKEIQSTADNEKVLTLKTAWRAKKGHHHLLFMAGNDFLHGLSLEQ